MIRRLRRLSAAAPGLLVLLAIAPRVGLAERLLEDLRRAVAYFEAQKGHVAKQEGTHYQH